MNDYEKCNEPGCPCQEEEFTFENDDLVVRVLATAMLLWENRPADAEYDWETAIDQATDLCLLEVA